MCMSRPATLLPDKQFGEASLVATWKTDRRERNWDGGFEFQDWVRSLGL